MTEGIAFESEQSFFDTINRENRREFDRKKNRNRFNEIINFEGVVNELQYGEK